MKTARQTIRALARLAPLAAAAVAAVHPPAALAATLTLSQTAVTCGSVVAETTGNKVVLDLAMSSSAGTINVSGMKVSLPTGVANVNVRTLQLWNDANNNGAVDTGDTLIATAGWSRTLQKYVFGGFNIAVTNPTVTNLLVTAAVGVPYVNASSYGAASASAFSLSVAPADVTVGSGNTVTGGPFTSTSCAITNGTLQEGNSTAKSTAPMIIILNPGDGEAVSPAASPVCTGCPSTPPANSFRVQVQVYSPVGTALSNVQLSFDNGATFVSAPALAVNTNYAAVVGTNAYIYEAYVPVNLPPLTFPPAAGTLNPGTYTLRARATNASGTVNSAAAVIHVNNVGEGDGNLLARDNASQMCIDCHAIKTHSSQTTTPVGTTVPDYGSWATTCRDCHAPHGMTNISLVKNVIIPPSVNGFQSARAVNFGTMTGDSGIGPITTASFGTSSFANSDNTGPCQVCHTRTTNPPTNSASRWRNTGNTDTHYTKAAGTQACIGCHAHTAGFAAGESQGGVKCSGCHSTTWANMTAAQVGTNTAHYLGNVVGSNDAFADTAVAWNVNTFDTANPPANRSCVNMCHGDHVHDLTSPVVASHLNNVYLNAQTNASRADNSGAATQTKTSATRASTDFTSGDPNGGMCLSCHQRNADASHLAVSSAGYDASAHDYVTAAAGTTVIYTTWQFQLHDGSAFNRNCTKCHSSPSEGVTGSVGGTIQGVHWSSYPSLLAGTTNPKSAPGTFICYNCHGNNTVGKNLSGHDVYTLSIDSTAHPMNADSLHDSVAELAATYNNGAFYGAKRHVNCLDCHRPHRAGNTLHAVGTNTIGTASPLLGETGVSFAALTTSNFPTPVQGNFTWQNPATLEPNVCFKCHSSYAWGTQVAPVGLSGRIYTTGTATFTNASTAVTGSGTLWSTTAGAGTGWLIKNNADGVWYRVATVASATSLTLATAYAGATASGAAYTLQEPESDVARDFNTGNQSYHPVLGALPASDPSTAYGSVRLVAAQLTGGWTPGQIMTCSDCHGSDANTVGVQGPHGSAADFLLKGPNTRWPFQANGTTYWQLGNATTGSGTRDGLFCLNCHPVTGTNTAHTTSNHNNYACVNCHIAVPHGGKVSRLIVTQNAPAPYNQFPPGNVSTGNFRNSYELTLFNRAATYTGYNETNYCGNNPGCYSGHTMSTGESW